MFMFWKIIITSFSMLIEENTNFPVANPNVTILSKAIDDKRTYWMNEKSN